MSSLINNPSTIEDLKQNIEFQIENVQGWISVNDYQSALIKAKCLVDALQEIVIAEEKEQIPTNAKVTFELQGKCPECGKVTDIIQPPDQYEGWCMDCARSDAMADSDAYDARTEQIEGSGW